MKKTRKIRFRPVSVCVALAVPSVLGWATSVRGQEPARKSQADIPSAAISRITSSVLSNAILSNMIGGSGVFRIRLGAADEPLKAASGSTVEPSGNAGFSAGSGLRVGGLAASGDSEKNWNVWFTPARSSFANNIQPFTSKGAVTLGLLGLEYNHEDTLIGGIALSFDDIDATTTYNGGEIRGGGRTFSPYLVYQLDESWLADASFGIGKSNLESRVGAVLGSPVTDRTFGALGVTYIKMFGKATLMGKAGYNYFRDSIGAYRNSEQVLNDSLDTKLSQFKVGAQVSYDGMKPLVPFVGAYQYFNNLSSSSPDRSAQEYASTWQYVLGLNFSQGLFYGSVAYQVERDKTQLRIYGGVRF